MPYLIFGIGGGLKRNTKRESLTNKMFNLKPLQMKASKAKAKPVVKKSLRQTSEDVTYKGIGYAIKILDGLKEVAIGAYQGTSRAIEDYQLTDKDL